MPRLFKGTGNNMGEINGVWKGDAVGYTSLHEWVRNRKKKPKFCGECKSVPPYDLANISQEYRRDINDFEWLCRSCHMLKEGRVKKTGWFNSCKLCDKQIWVKPSIDKKGGGKFCSNPCYVKFSYK